MAPATPGIVLVGCGEIATVGHLPALRSLQAAGEVALLGVCDGDPARAEQAARAFGVARHDTDWRRLVADTGAQAVSLCVPPGPNAELAVAALEAGLHVLCEKPPGRTLQQAAAMAAAAAARPELVHMIAFNRRFAPLYVRAMERSRRLAPPHAFHGRFTRGALGAAPSNGLDDWITSDGSHALDLAVATIGYPTSVSVTRAAAGAGPDNVWTVQLAAPSGAAVLVFDFAAGRRVERFEWSGAGYDVLLELPMRGEWSQMGAPAEAWRAGDVRTGDEPDFALDYGFVGEYRRFAQAVTGAAPPPEADFAYGLAFMRLARTILESGGGDAGRVTLPPPAGNTDAARAGVVRVPADAHLPAGTASPNGAGAARRARTVVQVLQGPAAQRAHFPPTMLSELGDRCEVRLPSTEDAPVPDLADVEVLVAGWGAPPVPREQLERAERLRLVVVVGASVRWALDAELAQARGIALSNTADAIGASVAEHCLLLTLAGLRRLTDVDRQMRRGGWPPQGRRSPWSPRALAASAARLPGVGRLRPMLGPPVRRLLGPAPRGGAPWHDLREQVVGLVGWGNVARRFAELLRPFDCRVLVWSEHASDEELTRAGARRAAAAEVLGGARVVSLHKGLVPGTERLLDADRLALLRPGTVVVNTARAGLFDEAALLARVREGDCVFALDVFPQEPLDPRSPLRRMPNVILTPHNAGSTPQCRLRAGGDALRQVMAWSEGQPVRALEARQLATMT